MVQTGLCLAASSPAQSREAPHPPPTDLCALITLRAAHHPRRHSKRPVDIAHDVRVAQLICAGKVEWPALPHRCAYVWRSFTLPHLIP